MTFIGVVPGDFLEIAPFSGFLLCLPVTLLFLCLGLVFRRLFIRDVFDVLLGQPYMWRHYVVYESRPRSAIVTFGGYLYRILEVVPTILPPKQCHKVVSHTAKFSFFTICSKGELKNTTTTAALVEAPSSQHKKVEKIE